MKKGYLKTKKRLQIAIDNACKIDGMQDYLDRNFAYLEFDLDGGREEDALNGKLFSVPYWCNEGSISYGLTGDQDYDPEKCQAQYITGYCWNKEYGEEKTFDGKKYRFITTISLPEEMEHQAEDGECAHEYRGYSFLAIWEELPIKTLRLTSYYFDGRERNTLDVADGEHYYTSKIKFKGIENIKHFSVNNWIINELKSGLVVRVELQNIYFWYTDRTTEFIVDKENNKSMVYYNFSKAGIEIYDFVKKSGIPFDSHESDLYVKATPETRLMKNNYPVATFFHSRVEQELWIEFPFEFIPFWAERNLVK